MNKILMPLIIVVILIGFIGYNMLGMGGPSVVEIQSDDGKATLYVSSDALPDGVTLDDISITSGELSGFYGSGTSVFGYDLQPNGLEFTKPIQVSVVSDWDAPENDLEVGIPFLVHKSGDDFDIVDNTEIVFDKEKKSLEIRGDIEHFSHLSVSPKPYVFRLNMTPVKNAQLEETQTISITSTHKRYQESEYSRLYGVPEYTPVGDTWSLESNANLEISGKSFTPNKVEIPSSTQAIDQDITVSGNVTCVKKGYSDFIVRGKFTFVSDLEMLIPFYHKKYEGGTTGENDYNSEAYKDFHKIVLLKNKKMTPILTLASKYVECAEEQWVQLRPYMIICPDGTSKNGTYIIDPDTGEPELSDDGFELEASTRIPADDDCRGYMYKE